MLHAGELFRVLAEPLLYEFIEEEPPASVEALRQKLARSESRRSPDGSEHWLNWIVRDTSRRVAGYVQATITANGEANVAYILGSEFWGRGLGYLAVAEMLRVVVAEFQVKTFFVVAERANERSIRLAARLGFTAATPELSAQKGVSENDILMQKLVA